MDERIGTQKLCVLQTIRIDSQTWLDFEGEEDRSTVIDLVLFSRVQVMECG